MYYYLAVLLTSGEAFVPVLADPANLKITGLSQDLLPLQCHLLPYVLDNTVLYHHYHISLRGNGAGCCGIQVTDKVIQIPFAALALTTKTWNFSLQE